MAHVWKREMCTSLWWEKLREIGYLENLRVDVRIWYGGVEGLN
jgi:hypothetical protein